MSDKLQHQVDVFLTIIGMSTGIAGLVNDVEQYLRIFLLFISIVSGVLLILVNFKKAINSLKDIFKK